MSGATSASSSSWTMSSAPFMAARCNGPIPMSFRTFTLHLDTISACTTSWCSFQQARCNGVHPSFRCWSTSHFTGTSTLTTPAWPLRAAQWSGFDPVLSRTLTRHPLCPTRVCRVEMWPFQLAQCSAVHPYCGKDIHGGEYTAIQLRTRSIHTDRRRPRVYVGYMD